jgi:hypothetical protein
MLNSKSFICAHTYDPCYGLKILRPGDTITVTEDIDSSPEYPRYRVTWQSNDGPQQGWGWVIYGSDLARHFRLA